MPISAPLSPLVSAEWLHDHYQKNTVRIVDASFKMPGVTPTCREDYIAHHIPGAVFFDTDAVADHTTDLPHMVPSPEEFSRAMGALGLSNHHHIVVYDSNGLLGAARAWWCFRLFGHTQISVLNGGMRAWHARNYPTTSEPTILPPEQYTARFLKNLLRTRDEILQNTHTQREQLVDARSSARFHGDVPEPRPGLRRGHIPHSLNLDYAALIDSNSACLKDRKEIQQKFFDAGIDLQKPIVTSCGSGVSACTLALALADLGYWDTAVYDGSWAEWGASSLPISGRS